MDNPEAGAKPVVVMGNHERLVQCECGQTMLVPVNALSTTCPKCNGTLVGFSSFGVQQR
jgi:hypothetical protein